MGVMATDMATRSERMTVGSRTRRPRGARRPTAVALTLGLGLAAAACNDPVGPGEPITELPRQLSAAEMAVVDASSGFGLELLRETVALDDRPNVVLSPLSASMALGMTMNGTDGATFEAMRSALAFEGMTQAEINGAYADLITLLTDLDPAVRFEIANAIWTNEDVPFHQAFLDVVSDAFGARTESSDFADPATLDAINRWADESTDGLIEKILDQLDPKQVAILLNAIYFDGAWTTRFDPDDTRVGAFTLADGSTVDVEMMSISDEEVPLGGGDGYSAAELPYGGGAYAMVIVVPHDDARAFVAGLDLEGWRSIIDGLSPREVDALSIPKLTLTYDAYLNDALKAMGMEVAFGPGADFTRMSPVGHELCIDFVRQKTFLEVDERGTRAAAVTAVGIGPVSFVGLIADRPFLFAIRERLSGTILFTGLIGDPTADDPGPQPYVDTC